MENISMIPVISDIHIKRCLCFNSHKLSFQWDTFINYLSDRVVFNTIMKSSPDERNVLRTNQEINSLSFHFREL